MKIRAALLEDIPAIVEMSKSVFSETRFKIYGFDADRIAGVLKPLVEDETGVGCVMLAVAKDEKVVGCVIGRMEANIFSDKPVASVSVYIVSPSSRMGGAGLKLLTAFKKWAENRGAFEMYVGISSGTDAEKMDKFLRKLGLVYTGGNYALKLG